MISDLTYDQDWEFLANLKDLTFKTTAGACSIAIASRSLNANIYEVSLYPDSRDEIAIYDLPALLETYVRDAIHDIFTVTITELASDDDAPGTTYDTRTVKLKVAYSSEETESLVSFQEWNFLTSPRRRTRTAAGRKEILNLLQYEAAVPLTTPTVTARAYFADGTFQDTALTPTAGDTATEDGTSITYYTIDVSPDQFADSDKVLMCYVVKSGNRSMEYYLDTEHEEPSVAVLFKNSFGVYEAMYCYGRKESDAKYERSSVMIRGKYQNYRIKETRTWNADTGVLTEEEREWALMLMRSMFPVFECKYSGGTYESWREIAITESECKYTDEPDNLARYTFKYRAAGRSQNDYQYRTFPRIFTDTYTPEYE